MPKTRCIQCDYRLDGTLLGSRCPECGRSVLDSMVGDDPKRVERENRFLARETVYRRVRRLSAIGAIVVIVGAWAALNRVPSYLLEVFVYGGMAAAVVLIALLYFAHARIRHVESIWASRAQFVELFAGRAGGPLSDSTSTTTNERCPRVPCTGCKRRLSTIPMQDVCPTCNTRVSSSVILTDQRGRERREGRMLKLGDRFYRSYRDGGYAIASVPVMLAFLGLCAHVLGQPIARLPDDVPITGLAIGSGAWLLVGVCAAARLRHVRTLQYDRDRRATLERVLGAGQA